jgi:hypothetical protein
MIGWGRQGMHKEFLCANAWKTLVLDTGNEAGRIMPKSVS